MKWDPNLYDQQHSFVSRHGEDLIKILDPKEKEDILDVGCGTGDLTNIIQKSGAKVIGMDSSEEMISKALKKYPHLDFSIKSADNFDFESKFDAVFSNATLHWVLEKEKAVDCIYRCLKANGRFVAEFGGKGNVQNIIEALKRSLNNHGYQNLAEKKVWYFPTLSEYTTLLEQKGFSVEWAAHFERETLLKDSDGIKNWIFMFGKSYLEGISPKSVDLILKEVEELIRPTNFKNDQWFADYARLRVLAVKG